LDRTQEKAQFALDMMEDSQIRVVISTEMPLLAKQARKELLGASETSN
jgi:hypothetical protein